MAWINGDEGQFARTIRERTQEDKRASDKTQYSISITTNNRPVVVVNDDITKGLTTDKEIKNAVRQAITKFKRVPINKQSIHFISDTASEYTNSKYTRWLEHNDRQTFFDKMRVGQYPQDIVYATTDYINEGLKHPRKDNIVDFARGKILIDVAGTQYEAEAVMGFTKSGICELHYIVKMTPTLFEYKKDATSEGIGSFTEPTRSDVTSSNNRISPLPENVNTHNKINLTSSKRQIVLCCRNRSRDKSKNTLYCFRIYRRYRIQKRNRYSAH